MATVDVAVVCGGVVGCAVARKLTLQGFSVVLLEPGPDILSGASKANSALLHTGFDAPPGSLETELMQRGRVEFLAIRDRLNLPMLATDAMVAAWTEDELQRLDAIEAQVRLNGVVNVVRLSRADVLSREPDLELFSSVSGL